MGGVIENRSPVGRQQMAGRIYGLQIRNGNMRLTKLEERGGELGKKEIKVLPWGRNKPEPEKSRVNFPSNINLRNTRTKGAGKYQAQSQ